MPTAFRGERIPILTTIPTGTETAATARAGSDHAAVLMPVRGASGAADALIGCSPRSTVKQRGRSDQGSARVVRSYSAQPILFAMLFAAVVKAMRAFVAPAPCVDLTQAAPRSVLTQPICGMFGIGTPPTPAFPNCDRIGSEYFPTATAVVGERLLAFAGTVCAL